MKIMAAQYNPIVGDVKRNSEKVVEALNKAKSRDVDLLVFPELFLAGYPPKDLLLYQSFHRELENRLRETILPEVQKVAMLLGAPWWDEEKQRLYNTALFLQEGSLVCQQHKALLPNYDVFDESRYFSPAEESKIIKIKGRNIGITVCEDIWNDVDFWGRSYYSRDPLKELLPQKPELVINISASPYYWGKFLLRHRMFTFLSRKYQKSFLFVNQVGGHDELIFDGNSALYSEEGELQRATAFQEELFEVDTLEFSSENKPARNSKVFSFESPGSCYLLENYPNTEEHIGWVKSALICGLQDYLKKTGFEKVVLGISGGVDSALTAALAVEALGKEKVLGLVMPSRYTSPDSLDDAYQLAKNLGIEIRNYSIEEAYSWFLQLFQNAKVSLLDTAEENLQARLRGNIIMFISNRERRLVLATGNKTELAVGYCTLYGDLSGGLAVLGDVPKTTVYKLARHINHCSPVPIIPLRILEKEPSAELKPGQVDSQSLPPYERLDEILYYYIEENASQKEIVARGYSAREVGKIIALVEGSEHKRYQAPPSLKVSYRTFSSGRKMPLIL